jgi:hypothetical protein
MIIIWKVVDMLHYVWIRDEVPALFAITAKQSFVEGLNPPIAVLGGVCDAQPSPILHDLDQLTPSSPSVFLHILHKVGSNAHPSLLSDSEIPITLCK